MGRRAAITSHGEHSIVSDWQRILLQIGIHFAVIHYLIAFARMTQWIIFTLLGGIVAGFVVFILLTIPAPTPSDLTRIEGVLEGHVVDSGNFLVYLRDDNRVFAIYDTDFFQQERFLQEVKSGEDLSLAVLRKLQNQTSRPLVVFEVTAHGTTYLPAEPLLRVRQRDRRVTLPLILICSVIVVVSTLIAAVACRPVYDTILGSFIGTLLMLVLDFYFPKTNLSSLIPSLALLLIYPVLLLVENRFREFDRATWLIAGSNYLVMIAFAGAALRLAVSH
jgi:hypothetical protein